MNTQSRIAAVDALRGLAIAAMILVNNPGSWSHVYAPMLHAKWHGMTPTDLIFPLFIFIVGIAAAYSLPRQLAKGVSRRQVMRQALVRAAKLLLLGGFLAVFYYNFAQPDYDWWQSRVLEIRLPGVLQRIGVVFALTAALLLWLGRRGIAAAFVITLASYWLLMALVPYADASGTTYVGQWQFGNSLSAWLDHHILGPAHLYYADAKPFSFDPEGTLSTLPALSTSLSGVLTGMYLQITDSHARKALMTMVCGVACIALGYALSPLVPVNKALWTPSYVFLSSGWSLVALSVLLYVMDVRRWQGWATPLIVCGANSIAFYMLAGILARCLMMVRVENTSLHGYLYNDWFAPVFGPLNGSLAFAVCFLVVCYLPVAWMYRKRIFWKV